MIIFFLIILFGCGGDGQKGNRSSLPLNLSFVNDQKDQKDIKISSGMKYRSKSGLLKLIKEDGQIYRVGVESKQTKYFQYLSNLSEAIPLPFGNYNISFRDMEENKDHNFSIAVAGPSPYPIRMTRFLLDVEDRPDLVEKVDLINGKRHLFFIDSIKGEKIIFNFNTNFSGEILMVASEGEHLILRRSFNEGVAEERKLPILIGERDGFNISMENEGSIVLSTLNKLGAKLKLFFIEPYISFSDDEAKYGIGKPGVHLIAHGHIKSIGNLSSDSYRYLGRSEEYNFFRGKDRKLMGIESNHISRYEDNFLLIGDIDLYFDGETNPKTFEDLHSSEIINESIKIRGFIGSIILEKYSDEEWIFIKELGLNNFEDIDSNFTIYIMKDKFHELGWEYKLRLEDEEMYRIKLVAGFVEGEGEYRTIEGHVTFSNGRPTPFKINGEAPKSQKYLVDNFNELNFSFDRGFGSIVYSSDDKSIDLEEGNWNLEEVVKKLEFDGDELALGLRVLGEKYFEEFYVEVELVSNPKIAPKIMVHDHNPIDGSTKMEELENKVYFNPQIFLEFEGDHLEAEYLLSSRTSVSSDTEDANKKYMLYEDGIAIRPPNEESWRRGDYSLELRYGGGGERKIEKTIEFNVQNAESIVEIGDKLYPSLSKSATYLINNTIDDVAHFSISKPENIIINSRGAVYEIKYFLLPYVECLKGNIIDERGLIDMKRLDMVSWSDSPSYAIGEKDGSEKRLIFFAAKGYMSRGKDPFFEVALISFDDRNSDKSQFQFGHIERGQFSMMDGNKIDLSVDKTLAVALNFSLESRDRVYLQLKKLVWNESSQNMEESNSNTIEIDLKDVNRDKKLFSINERAVVVGELENLIHKTFNFPLTKNQGIYEFKISKNNFTKTLDSCYLTFFGDLISSSRIEAAMRDNISLVLASGKVLKLPLRRDGIVSAAGEVVLKIDTNNINRICGDGHEYYIKIEDLDDDIGDKFVGLIPTKKQIQFLRDNQGLSRYRVELISKSIGYYDSDISYCFQLNLGKKRLGIDNLSFLMERGDEIAYISPISLPCYSGFKIKDIIGAENFDSGIRLEVFFGMYNSTTFDNALLLDEREKMSKFTLSSGTVILKLVEAGEIKEIRRFRIEDR